MKKKYHQPTITEKSFEILKGLQKMFQLHDEHDNIIKGTNNKKNASAIIRVIERIPELLSEEKSKDLRRIMGETL